jgi:hypothetical protein
MLQWASGGDHPLVVGERVVAPTSMVEGGGEACCISEVLAQCSGHGICWRVVAVVLTGVLSLPGGMVMLHDCPP